MIEQSILLHVQQSIYYTSSCGRSICNLNLMPHPIILGPAPTLASMEDTEVDLETHMEAAGEEAV